MSLTTGSTGAGIVPFWQTEGVTLYCGDALVVLPAAVPTASVDLAILDPPYFRLKREWWDRQWDNVPAFLQWLDRQVQEWQRVLKPNGSLYVFTYPRLAWEVESCVRQHLRVLSSITWDKWNTPGRDGWKHKAQKEALRMYWPASERIIFAEQYRAEDYALAASGYGDLCRRLREGTFAPLQEYLRGELRRAGLGQRVVLAALGLTGHDTHFFSAVQWKLPTGEQYAALRRLFRERGRTPPPSYGDYHRAEGLGRAAGEAYLAVDHATLAAEYERLLREFQQRRADSEQPRQAYAALRRPFLASPDRPYTDVWHFQSVPQSRGKHPCEKPVPLLEHMVLTSSRPGDVVLDCFMGRASTGVAARRTGRDFIGVDIAPKWCQRGQQRLEQETSPGGMPLCL